MIFLIVQLDTLRVGDVLQIDFIGYNYQVKTIIDNDGYALIQPFGYFKLANVDLISAQDSIFQKIKDIYPLAKISIIILNKISPKVYIMTNKELSAVIDYQKGMDIRFVLFSSGKFQDEKIKRVILIRNSEEFLIKKENYDFPLMPNDVIKVYLKEEFRWQDLLPFLNLLTNTISLLILLGIITPR